MENFKVAVLMGGVSSEREVSLVSGKFVYESVRKNFDSVCITLDKNELPKDISPDDTIVFPVMHGEYGEDGTLQKELEGAGFAYAGTNSIASRVCMNKPAAKALMNAAGLNVAKGIAFSANEKPSASAAIELLGERLILKPADKGSSVGLKTPNGKTELEDALSEISDGQWMLESFFKGREFSVGVIGGKAAGIVEIIPEGGVYDFKRKYTNGATRYEFPAHISENEERGIKQAAEKAYASCGCRDFSRVDFLMDERGNFIVLEINTLPGMTPTSLLPKSASCAGYDFDGLCKKMLEGAIKRFQKNI
ncbi:MAG: D-alanine--D-alanine ligase [Opitutales bacterium]|nr:D-alanine--D-alanine ligase [Opitutales bacterium]